jgi:hypothetical protein
MQVTRRIFAAALFALVLPVTASAQSAPAAKLATGTWSGSIRTPGNPEPTYLTYEVEYKADTLAITMVVPEEGKFPLEEINFADQKLAFSFVAGPKVSCVLAPRDTGFDGNCTDEEGNNAPITMRPPAQEPSTK